jgi:hypothetical protein
MQATISHYYKSYMNPVFIFIEKGLIVQATQAVGVESRENKCNKLGLGGLLERAGFPVSLTWHIRIIKNTTDGKLNLIFAQVLSHLSEPNSLSSSTIWGTRSFRYRSCIFLVWSTLSLSREFQEIIAIEY